jgi:Tfp pilus assembly protein PilO
MKSLGRRPTIAIAAVACVAVLASGWFLLVKPVKKDISAVKAQTVEQTANNASLLLQLGPMRTIAKNLPAELIELATLSQRVPDQVQLPALLRSMQAVAKDSGVTLKGITPTLPTPLAAAPGIASVGIVLNVSGGYAELEQFDAALEGLKRTFQVSGFTLTGGAAAGAATADITATFSGRVLLHSTAAAATTAGH